jgi:hypothetical protein
VAWPQTQQQSWIPQEIAALAQSATSRSEFSFDHSMLVLASKSDQNDEGFRRVIAGVDGISVHRFRFQEPTAYNPELLNALRQQYGAAGWQHLGSAHAKEGGPGATDVWLRFANQTIRNIAVLRTGHDQINFVSVSCAISPLDLLHLAGHFGIPHVDGGVVLPSPAPRGPEPPPGPSDRQ